MNKLFNIGNLVEGIILKRPSATCKTPYVADVLLNDNNIVLAHTTSLGCGGLADKDSKVLMLKIDNKKNVCKYKIIISVVTEKNITQYIGIDTSLPEKIVKQCLLNNYITNLSNLKQINSQITFLNSRFDFAGIDENNNEFILEVKNTPLADYVDCLKKDKKKLDFTKFNYYNKISYFPDGYRKKITDTVSPRALKHAQELTQIKKTTNKRTILCYVIQRTDVSSFQPSNIDPIYKKAIIEAHENGVEILPLVIKWEKNGDCYFISDNLKINI
tara:strand:- start:12278 stop:13096 length:819 start_codon:yes stop_codon:yes gene_type:complete